MINITFPDNSVKEFAEGSTPLDIAKALSNSLAKEVLSASFNGQPWDATRPINEDGTLVFYKWDDEEGKHTFRHSAAHLMAEALEALYPGTKFGIGPALENGFYYDVLPAEGQVIKDSDFAAIENKMMELRAKKEVLVRKSISKADYMRNSTQGSIVLFYHTLAGVKFKSANAENEDKHSFNVQTTIKSIKMTNILSEGHCKVTPTYDQEGYSQDDSNERGTTEAEGKQDVDKSEKCSIWTGVKTVKEYSLVNPGVVSYEDATVDFDDSFQGSDTQNYGDYNLNTADYSNTFYFVPQKTGYVKNDTDGTYTKASYDVELTIVYELSNHNGQFTKTVKFNSQDWKAGHIYTYTLSANTVEVLIDDDMSQDGRTKSNLTITNTGNTDAYMRVAVVANWYDKNHQIVAPWGGLTDTWDGECSLGEDKNVYDTENWTYNGGYYYYKWKVKPGYDIISELFSQYKVKDCNRTEYNMYAGKAHLEMDIMVQSFNASKIGEMAEYGWHTAAFDPHYDDARTADLN